MSDVMSVRLHLSGIRVRGVGVDSVDRLEVEVESAREWSRCRQCGFKCRRVWDRRAKRVRDLGGERPSRDVGLASPPVRVWELRGTPPRGPRPVRSRPVSPVCSSPGGRWVGDVNVGQRPAIMGLVGIGSWAWSARRRLGWRSVAGPVRVVCCWSTKRRYGAGTGM